MTDTTWSSVSAEPICGAPTPEEAKSIAQEAKAYQQQLSLTPQKLLVYQYERQQERDAADKQRLSDELKKRCVQCADLNQRLTSMSDQVANSRVLWRGKLEMSANFVVSGVCLAIGGAVLGTNQPGTPWHVLGWGLVIVGAASAITQRLVVWSIWYVIPWIARLFSRLFSKRRVPQS
jgi:hypothetical protein